MNAAPPGCWVLSDGKAGTENQCLGLADAVGLPYEVRRLTRGALSWVPAGIWAHAGTLALRLASRGADLAPPWPRLLIAAGRPAVGPAIALRRAARGATFVVQLQDPRVAPHHFDLVVPPEHDAVTGSNVISTVGALHRITESSLAAAHDTWRRRFAPLPTPRIAVLIGGSSKHHRMTPAVAARLGNDLRTLCQTGGAGLMITASRRTDAASLAALKTAIEGLPADLWDGRGDNPYQGMLACADGIVVTADSVTMASEAASTGKPLFVAPLDGGSDKFTRFHEDLAARGISRPFAGRWETWAYPPLRETDRIAAVVRERLGAA
jgi:mitochondrial fission protein ELM1